MKKTKRRPFYETPCRWVTTMDQPNSRKKMHDFTAEFLKCVKFHGKFTERVWEIHGPHRRYFEVLC